jgi:hypothetical protein
MSRCPLRTRPVQRFAARQYPIRVCHNKYSMSATLTPTMAATPSPTRNIRRSVLPNGLLVLTESIPHVRSASMGPARVPRPFIAPLSR